MLTKSKNKRSNSVMLSTLKSLTFVALTLFISNINVSAQIQKSDTQSEISEKQSAPAETPQADLDSSTDSQVEVVSKRPFPFRGTIAKIDLEKKVIELKGKKSNRKMILNKETKMIWHDEKADLAKAKVGQQVGGSCLRLSDGTYQLVMIRFGPKDWEEEQSSSAQDSD